MSSVIAVLTFIILNVLLTLTEPWVVFVPFVVYNATLALFFMHRVIWTRVLVALASLALWTALTRTHAYHNSLLACMTCIVMHHLFFGVLVNQFVVLEKIKNAI